jgi:leucyl-tRNA synthetase
MYLCWFRQMPYAFNEIEEKWQKVWEKERTDKTADTCRRDKKCYVLEMLPYPSGKIHMGHVRNYCIGDVIARYKKALGYSVLHPMGWDAFGMPAENAAMQNGTHPKIWTLENIKSMRAILLRLGLSYDWDREISTCSEEYYGTEQHLFLEMYNKGLVYRKSSWVNWDPVDNTVLANEQVVDGKGWRSGAQVVRKLLPHWCLKITNYADELLANLDSLTGSKSDDKPGWPEKVLVMQKNWIGKSEGCLIDFNFADSPLLDDYEESCLKIFTTRPETLYGASFCAVAFEHPLTKFLCEKDARLAKFLDECLATPTTESAVCTAEKVGYNSGLFVLNPVDEAELLPIFITNFVLMEYGTGAIFGCPAHDERDFDFAKKYGLPICRVIDQTCNLSEGECKCNEDLPYVEAVGKMVNSRALNGLDVLAARKRIIEDFETAVRRIASASRRQFKR